MISVVLTLTLLATPPAEGPGVRTPAFIAAATVVSVGATVLGLGTGVLVHTIPFELNGRPNPWVTTGGLGVAAGVNVALAHLVVPLLAQSLSKTPDVARARATSWSLSRWALLAGGVGTLTYGVGAGVDEAAFGQGQALMVTGLLVTVVALFAWDVLEAVGAWSGTGW